MNDDEPEWYERILDMQLRENPGVWARFQEHGLDEMELRLGFIYLAPGEEEAQQLAGFLREETDYEVEVRAQRARRLAKAEWFVVGATQPTPVSLDLLNEWVEWMVAAGAVEGPCAFDGWAAQALESGDDDE
ncbi:MAG TPA: hypothetical protein VGO81_15810 [Solirubrobacteraceae bacterium]|jgi:hypothetical protein|nr:hypothetical protein [Solirubrobacteraceae bacterium]